MQHPTITKLERDGYLNKNEPREIAVDTLGNTVYEGDKILVYEDESYLVDALLLESITILESVGATYEIASDLNV